MENKKGITPVVATVLLIAIVLTIALIAFLWFRGFVQDSGQKYGRNVDLVCEEVDFDASFSPSQGSIFLANTGTVPIYSFLVEVYQGGGFDSFDIRSLTDFPQSGLKAQNTFSGVLDIDPIAVDKIVLVPILLAEKDTSQVAFQCSSDVGVELQI